MISDPVRIFNPRIEGLLKAISSYFDIPISELEALVRGERGGDGSEQDSAPVPSSLPIDGGGDR
jgi:hypothetical protein